MNKKRRAELDRGIKYIIQGKEILQSVLDEEQDCFDNLSEGLQQTMRGEAMENNVDILESVIDEIQSAIDDLDDIE